MKCAVFSCMGLGDGFITLVLSNNLKEAGWQVDTYHPFLQSIQDLFPKLSIFPFPKDLKTLEKYDRLFIIYEKSSWMVKILEEALKIFPEKTIVLNPIATVNCDYPFWENGKFDGNLSFVENLYRFAKNQLNITQPTKLNGMQLPEKVIPRKYIKRVIIHPTSSRKGKNWLKNKYLSLKSKLEKEGFEPIFILSEEEQKEWPEIKAPHFSDLKEMIYFIAESGWMIGNDSGIGHVASCAGLPTLIICRNQLVAHFWRPGWTKGKVIAPPRWIPNLKGIRWRDKKWQHFVSVRKVFETFQKMTMNLSQ